MSEYSLALRQVTGMSTGPPGISAGRRWAASETTVCPMDPWLPRAARMHPDRLAVVCSGAALSYAELLQRARVTAGALAARGLSPGDRVALALPAGVELVAALHGCWLVGAAAVPIDLRLRDA